MIPLDKLILMKTTTATAFISSESYTSPNKVDQDDKFSRHIENHLIYDTGFRELISNDDGDA